MPLEVLVGVPALAIGAAFPILSHAAGADEGRFAHATDGILELALIAGTDLALTVERAFVIDVLAGSRGAPPRPCFRPQGLAPHGHVSSVATEYALLSLRQHGALPDRQRRRPGGQHPLTLTLALALAPVPVSARGGPRSPP